MSSILPGERGLYARQGTLGLAIAGAVMPAAWFKPAIAATLFRESKSVNDGSHNSLSSTQLSIAPMAAAAAVGNMPRLSREVGRALDSGLTVAEVKEVLVQLYAYA